MNNLISPDSSKIPYDYVVSSGAMTSSATNVQSTLILEQDSWFELCEYTLSSSLDAATDQSPNNTSVQVTDLSTGRLMASQAIPQRVWAPYNTEYKLARPTAFPPNANLLFTFNNLIASTNTSTAVLRGYRYFNGPGQLITNQQCIPFDYYVTLTLAGNATGLVTLTLQQDSWFELHQIAGTCTADAVTGVMPNNFAFRMQDAKGPYFASALVPARIITPYNNKYMADRVIQFDPATNLSFNIQELSGGTNTVIIVLRGFKLFP